MSRRDLRVVVCGLLACWGCGSSRQTPRPRGDVDGTGGDSGDTGGTTGASGGSDRADSGRSTGGAGGVDASEVDAAATGAVGDDAGQPDTSAGPDASGPDAARSGCAGGAIAFNANVPTNRDPAMARVMVDFGNSTELPLGNSARTVEFWAFVRSTSWAGDANTMFEYGLVKPNQGFGLDFGGRRGAIDPYTNGTFDNDNQPTGLDPSKDQWVHFAMTYDGTAVVLYVNGVQDATHGARKTSPGNMLATARTALTIGGNPRGAYFNGYLDEVRLWNVARSQAEIVATMKRPLTGNEPGLAGYWKFDETSGTVAADSTIRPGHAKANGTLMAASPGQLPAWIPSTAPIGCP